MYFNNAFCLFRYLINTPINPKQNPQTAIELIKIINNELNDSCPKNKILNISVLNVISFHPDFEKYSIYLFDMNSIHPNT